VKLSTFLLRITFFLFIPILAATGTYIFLRTAFLDAADPANAQASLIEVAPGRSFQELCRELEAKGIVRYWWSFYRLSQLGGKDKKVKAGEYELSPNMSPRDILTKLTSGEVFKRKVLVKEGTSVFDVGKIVEEAGLLSSEDFIKALTDKNLLTVAGIKADSFEGYLFPETYQFSRPVTVKDVIWRMLEESDKHWLPEFTDRANELNLSRHELITLASIIEKESGNVEEQPLVSSVFHNRLNNGMRLESDPTVIYGIKDFNGDLTRQDLKTPHAYNTYTNFGLPPGPICNPGETAIRAALFPKESPYIFFVGNGAGSHVFSTTLQEHNEAVARYQLKKGGIAPEITPTPVPTPKEPILKEFPSFPTRPRRVR
jgi:UPF0755 protein